MNAHSLRKQEDNIIIIELILNYSSESVMKQIFGSCSTAIKYGKNKQLRDINLKSIIAYSLFMQFTSDYLLFKFLRSQLPVFTTLSLMMAIEQP